MAYGGRAEIIDATKKIAQQIKEGKLDVEDINENLFRKNLYIESEPDLVIEFDKIVSDPFIRDGLEKELIKRYSSQKPEHNIDKRKIPLTFDFTDYMKN